MNNRIYPRINKSFSVQVMPDAVGETIDISEAGLGMVLDKPLLSKKTNIKILLESKEIIEAEFKVIWNKQIAENNRITYGAYFTKLKEKDIGTLRKLIIMQHMVNVLKLIDKNDTDTTEKLSEFFTNDLLGYIKYFEELRSSLSKNLISINDSYDVFKYITDKVLSRADKIELSIDKKVVMKKIKESFRSLCGLLVYRGKIVKRAFEKPRGYPGDYLTIEYVYDNQSISNGMGICSDKYFLDDKYSIAVRNRKDDMREMLFEYLSHRKTVATNILNIACGSCREIKDIISLGKDKIGKVVFNLVDQDKEALDFSGKSLLDNLSDSIKANFFQHDIMMYIKESKKYAAILGKQDLIYSIGLADYLPDGILKKLLFFLFNQLNDNGVLIFAHKDIAMYKPVSADWWCDWTFYPRDEQKVLNLILHCGIKDININSKREKSGLIIFFTISKK
jgi:hypothetical protein